MATTDKLFHIGHRDRLRQKFLDGKITDDEMLELLLACVIPRRDVRPLARGLVRQFGGISQILNASMDSLMAYKGLGQNTAIFIKLIHAIMLNGYKYNLSTRPVFHNDSVLKTYCIMQLESKLVEEMHILYLDKDMSLLSDDIHSVGTINWSPIYEREIIKRALNLGAHSIVMLHNHPGAKTDFSMDDLDATTNIQRLLLAFDIKLHDHFLVSGGQLFSARDKGLLPPIPPQPVIVK